jgi:cytochrome c
MRFMMMPLAAMLAVSWPLQAALADGDATAGQTVFHKCAICHSVVEGQNHIGPSLFGVVGRKAGTEAGYNYSEAMKNFGKTWDAATLDTYLTHPRDVVPGTKMTFAGLADEQDRANVIAYLSTLK